MVGFQDARDYYRLACLQSCTRTNVGMAWVCFVCQKSTLRKGLVPIAWAIWRCVSKSGDSGLSVPLLAMLHAIRISRLTNRLGSKMFLFPRM